MAITPDSLDTTPTEIGGTPAVEMGDDPLTGGMEGGDMGGGDLGDLGGGDMGGFGDLGGGMGGGLGPDGQPLPPEKTPEELMEERSIARLNEDLKTFIIKNYKSLVNKEILEDLKGEKFKEDFGKYLQDLNWDDEVLTKSLNEKESFNKLVTDLINGKKEQKTGVDLKQNNSKDVKGNFMEKKIVLKDGTLVEASSDNNIIVKTALNKLSTSIRKANSLLKKYNDAKLKNEGLIALAKQGKSVKSRFKFSADDFMAQFEKAEDDLEEGTEEVGGLMDDESIDMGSDEVSTGGGLIETAEDILDTLNDVKEQLLGVEEAVEEVAEGESPADIMEEEGPDSEVGIEEIEEDTGEEEDGEVEEEEEEDEDNSMGVAASTIISKIKTKVAKMKTSAEKSQGGWPVQDKNKQKQTDNNLKYPDIKMNPAAVKDKMDAKLSPAGAGLDSKVTPGTGRPFNPKKAEVESEYVDIKTAERVRTQSIEDKVAQAKLSVELASQEQLKGLIDNPLKEAFIKNMVAVGASQEEAEKIAYVSYAEAYEDSQKLVIKEAFDTFMEFDLEEFVKVAKFTNDYEVKYAADSTDDVEVKEKKDDEEGTDESTVEASEKAPIVKTAALRGTPSSGKDDIYRSYWQDVSRRRKNGDI